MDWRLDQDYAFCDQLDLAGWAWQFLRREPSYQADYAEFIMVWHQLEAAYGVPPNRDFFRWKQDPRAWRSEAEIAGCGMEVCPGENDQVLIECWMGAKWGFRKFPIDPAIQFPEQLAWREFPIGVAVMVAGPLAGEPQPTEQLILSFDLSLPLPAQLEAAKRQLIAARQLLAKSGRLPPRNAHEGSFRWCRWLRLLDGLASGATCREISQTLDMSDPDLECAAAISMRGGGYRRLLMLDQ